MVLDKKIIIVPVACFVILPLFYSFVLTPFLASTSQPFRNISRVNIFVIDLDGGMIGQAFQGFANGVYSKAVPNFPTLQFTNYSSATNAQLDLTTIQNNVLYGQAWAALVVNPGASTRLLNVITGGCVNASSYTAKGAISFIWDEGRDSSLSDNVIYPIFSQLLPKFTQLIAAQLMKNPFYYQCFTNGTSYPAIYTFLSCPVDYTSVSITPISQSSPETFALLIGNILLCALSSLGISNAILNGMGPMRELNPFQRTLARTLGMLLVSFGMALAYTSILIGLSATGASNNYYSAAIFGQILGTQFAHSALWAFMHACMIVKEFAPFVLIFAFSLVSSSLGAFTTNMADLSYNDFYQIFPFRYSVNLIRHALYGAVPQLVNQCVSYLVLVSLFFIILFFGLSMTHVPKGNLEAKVIAVTDDKKKDSDNPINQTELVTVSKA